MSSIDRGKPVHISDESFDAVVGQPGVVLVDFWAPWCGPCHAIAPVLDELASDYDQGVTIAKVNIDDHQQKASQFGVRSIPTLVAFKDGEPVQTLVGVQTKAALTAVIDGLVKEPA